MEKNIRLNESQFNELITESVNRILTEMDWKTYANAERKWADHLMNHPDDPKRKSSIVGHRDSKDRYDVFTDDRLRKFNAARNDAFNRDYGYNTFDGDKYDMSKGTYEMDWSPEDSGKPNYFDRIGTHTATPPIRQNGRSLPPHRMREKFYLDSWNGEDSPTTKHETVVDYVNGRYKPSTKIDRPSVEPQYDDIPYMKARNRGNADIERYQNGKSKYVKGKGWQ